MNKEEILQKAITKAEENGFKNNLGNPDWTYSDKKLGYFDNLIKEHVYEAIIFSHSFAKAFFGEFKSEDTGTISVVCEYDNCWNDQITKDKFISQFGEEAYKEMQEGEYVHDGGRYWIQSKTLNPGWEYHLREMVVSENPLEYLAKFLKGK